MKNICIVAGARPNFVKVAPLMRALDSANDCVYTLVYAGCANDPTLEDSLFEDLRIARPQVYLGVDSTSLNEITSRVMASFDRYLDTHPTDVVIVVDDLASTMATAIVTKKRGVRLAHLVAGTRSFDIQMPKEINRLVIDALSDYLFTAGVKTHSVATREQGDMAQTFMVGNILMDTLRFNRQRLRQPVLDAAVPSEELNSGNYLVLTLNRRVLLSDETRLSALLQTLVTAAGDVPVVAPLRGKAAEVVSRLDSRIRVVPPLGYLEFGWLTAHARGIVTDSGNVAEEATFNGVPCITLNSYTEHLETVTVGTNVLVDGDAAKLSEALQTLFCGQWKHGALPDRWDGRTAERIVQVLLSL